MPKKLAQFQSESNPGKHYDIIEGDDNVIYCTCMRWKMSKSCKHLTEYFGQTTATTLQANSRGPAAVVDAQKQAFLTIDQIIEQERIRLNAM